MCSKVDVQKECTVTDTNDPEDRPTDGLVVVGGKRATGWEPPSWLPATPPELRRRTSHAHRAVAMVGLAKVKQQSTPLMNELKCTPEPATSTVSDAGPVSASPLASAWRSRRQAASDVVLAERETLIGNKRGSRPALVRPARPNAPVFLDEPGTPVGDERSPFPHAAFTHEGGQGGVGKVQQDAHFVTQQGGALVCGVFDGHGRRHGREASQIAARVVQQHVVSNLRRLRRDAAWLGSDFAARVLTEAFARAHAELRSELLAASEGTMRTYSPPDGAPSYLLELLPTDDDAPSGERAGEGPATARHRLRPPANACARPPPPAPARQRMRPPLPACNRLQPPATACHRLPPPATACNRRLQPPPATACGRLQPPATSRGGGSGRRPRVGRGRRRHDGERGGAAADRRRRGAAHTRLCGGLVGGSRPSVRPGRRAGRRAGRRRWRGVRRPVRRGRQDYSDSFGTSKATYVWLPLFVHPTDPGVVQVVWRDEWALNDTSLYPF